MKKYVIISYMENERNKAENEAKLKELETRLNEKIARAEKLENH